MATTVSAKVSEDLRRRIDAATEEGETRSAAIGRLLRAGLEAAQDNNETPALTERAATAALVALAISIPALVLSLVGPAPTAGSVLLTALLIFFDPELRDGFEEVRDRYLP